MNTLFVSGSCFALATALVAAPADAQTASAGPAQAVTTPAPAAADGQDVQEIVVTANKRAENISDVPMSITAITGDTLRQKGINSIADLTKVTPGLSYVDSGLGTPVFSLRGVGFFDTAIGARPTVSVYTDEVPLPFSVEAQGAAFDLDRVEVLKGPQGTLFGQNATGGAINYIAAKPQDTFHAGFTGSYSRFNTVDAQGYVTGPLAPDLDIRVAAHVVRGGGWQESYTRHDSNGEQNFKQGRVLLDWHPSDKLKIELGASGFVDRGDTQASQLIGILYVTPANASKVPLLGTYPLAPQNDRAADWDPGTDYRKDNKFYQLSGRIDYSLTDQLTLTSLTAWSHMSLNQNNDVDGTALPSSDIAVVGHVSSFSEELRLAGEMNHFHWVLGGNYSDDRSVENDYINFPYASANYAFSPTIVYDATNPYTTQHFTTKAVFGNVDLDVGKFTFHGGARYTQADLNFTGCTKVNDDSSGAAITGLFNILRAGQGLPAIPNLTKGQCQSLDATLTPNLRVSSLDQHNVSWRTGVDYKPNRDVLLYANVSRGYKAGSTTAPGAINLEEFDPVSQESVLAYEAGFKVALAHRTINLSGAAFYYDYHDKQLLGRRITTPNLLGALPALINVPKSRVEGAEGQVTVYPVKGLTLTAAGTYLNSKVTSNFVNYTILATQTNLQGQPFPYTPKWQFVFDAQYKFPLNDALNGILGGNANHRSATTAGFGGGGDDNFLYIKGYTLVDLRAGVEDADGKWGIQLFGRNVGNTYYWTNVAKFNDTVRRYAGMPATYGVQVNLKF
jgi:outer membrane receptor protein involved in Fe transport